MKTKNWFTSKYKLYGYEAEVSALQVEVFTEFINDFSPSVSVLRIFHQNWHFYGETSKNVVRKINVLDVDLMRGFRDDYLGTQADIEYKYSVMFLRAILSENHFFKGTPLDTDQEIHNKICTERRIAENYFAQSYSLQTFYVQNEIV